MKRIQLKRTKGWRLPPNTVKVDRSTKWGNPFRVGQDGTPEACVARFRQMLERDTYARLSATMIRRELRGKDLACWCKPGDPCHADVLLEIANA